jgi:hypothetical protein
MAAQEPGRRRPVKAASRRSRSRTARALTGLRRSGSGAPSGYGGVWTRGAQSLDCSTCCANWHTVMLSCTLCQASDLFVLFCRPTAPHLAPFIDLTKTRRSNPAAVSVQTHRSGCADLGRPHSTSCSPNRPKSGRRSCGGRLQIGRRKTTGTRLSGRTWSCPVLDSGRESGLGNSDAIDQNRHRYVSGNPARRMASKQSSSASLCLKAMVLLATRSIVKVGSSVSTFLASVRAASI